MINKPGHSDDFYYIKFPTTANHFFRITAGSQLSGRPYQPPNGCKIWMNNWRSHDSHESTYSIYSIYNLKLNYSRYSILKWTKNAFHNQQIQWLYLFIYLFYQLMKFASLFVKYIEYVQMISIIICCILWSARKNGKKISDQNSDLPKPSSTKKHRKVIWK